MHTVFVLGPEQGERSISVSNIMQNVARSVTVADNGDMWLGHG